MRFRICVLVVSCGLARCADAAGAVPPLPISDDSAHLVATYTDAMRVVFDRVDGKTALLVGGLGNELWLAPGQHKLRINCEVMGVDHTMRSSKIITVQVEPKGVYYLLATRGFGSTCNVALQPSS